MLLASGTRRALIVGQGTGVTAGEVTLWPELQVIDLAEVSTRRDFDRFERWLKIKRMEEVMVALLLLSGAAYGFWWGVVQKNFLRSEREQEPNEAPGDATRLFLGESISGTIGPPGVGHELHRGRGEASR